jgi:serine/threonine-protein kinase HipA
MGALEFFPLVDRGIERESAIEVDELVRLASQILADRERMAVSLGMDGADGRGADALKHILQVGTSAGGARAKAVIAWNPVTNEVRSGQARVGPGFQHWLMKFDGVHGNRDRELADPTGYGLIEYAYWMMARAAGIDMAESRLFVEHGRSHFMTRRFDRTDSGDKVHMQSLGALAHMDFNSPGAIGYEQVFPILTRLGMGADRAEQFFRRMVFNVVARNQDDHVKNIAFLMDRRGSWRLAPAFDVTYSFQADGKWTGTHQMSVNGRRDGFGMADFIACGKVAGLVRGRAVAIVQDVCETVAKWPEFAAAAGVPADRAEVIRRTFRMFET